jgi:G3E family GTPase
VTRGAEAEFVVLTGPLGSGKTTLLRDHLATPSAIDTGVIVNEAGAIDVDGAILSTGRNGLSLANLPNGCVCCSLGNDLLGAVEALLAERTRAGRTPFRQIVLECSGLAYPAPILRSLSTFQRHTFRLRILSTFDAIAGVPDDAMLPIVAAQLAAAQAVVVTKAEIADSSVLDRAVGAIASYNPLLEPIIFVDRAARAAAAFSPETTGVSRSRLVADQPMGHPRIKVFRVEWAAPVAWSAISDWLDGLSDALGDRLLRVKGVLDVEGCPDALLVESVGTAFSTPRRLIGQAGTARGLVVIARDVDARELSYLPGTTATSASILETIGRL